MSTVLQLSQRVGSYEAALVAYRAAKSRLCLQELRSVPGGAASALRARAALRSGDPQRAIAELPASESSNWFERSEHAMLRAVALNRLGLDDHSAELDEARAFAISCGDSAREAEVEYYVALAASSIGDVEGAVKACRRGLVSAGPSTAKVDGRPIPSAHIIARLEELIGALYTAEGRYDLQLFQTREAIAILDDCPIKDTWQEGFALVNLCLLARDFDLPEDTALVASRVSTLAWTEDLRPSQFRGVEGLSWCAMLRGDNVGALRLFRQAAAIATTVPERIQVSIDRAVHARSLGHNAMAHEEVEFALDAAEQFDWNHAPGDTRDVLLALAQVATPIAPRRARTMLNRYNAIRTAMSTVYFARLEARVRAEEAYTNGVLLRAEGQLTASTERLENAFTGWQSIGYEWRASRAAIELAELDAGDVFRFAVRRELRNRPDSVFAGRARLIA